MGNIAISVENLSKQYQIGELENYYALRDSLTNILKYPVKFFSKNGRNEKKQEIEYIWALKDINFEVQHGEIIGIIGRNGAGKSTLLKILSRITTPTEGRVKINGRVGSLLEVGTGFHPELTGRENIYLNGSILGMSKDEIERKFEEIVDFAEVEKFLDTPVKRYSSGMYVRLAFAVAAHLEPEILIVDEVLAVGDMAFQKKCLGKMGEVSKQGRTVLFVSHNMGAISSLCSRGILFSNGEIYKHGDANEVVSYYLSNEQLLKPQRRDLNDKVNSNEKLVLTDVKIINENMKEIDTIMSGENIVISMNYKATENIKNPRVKITLYNRNNSPLAHFDNYISGIELPNLSLNGSINCKIIKLPLSQGYYRCNISISDKLNVLTHIDNAVSFNVIPGNYEKAGYEPQGVNDVCLIKCNWDSK